MSNTMAETMAAVNTIWGQLGFWNKASCGARAPRGADVEGKPTLTFDVTVRPGSKHTVTITLEPSDTYSVMLTRRRAGRTCVLGYREDIYCDVVGTTVRRLCEEFA